jgi:hypothetical protein
MASSMTMGNIQAQGIATLTLSPASVAANTTAEQTFTLPGVRTSDMIIGVSRAGAAQAGLGIVGWRVTAADTLGITFSNNTASPIVPTASTTYLVEWARTDATTNAVAG